MLHLWKCFRTVFLSFEQPPGQRGFVDPEKESRVEEMLQWMCFHSPRELQLQSVSGICSQASLPLLVGSHLGMGSLGDSNFSCLKVTKDIGLQNQPQ